jgi:phospholipid/cholesterol/gamma-HCH transport system substrate-binding protein
MQKQAPTFGRLLVMTLFALSCFGLLLFLWVSFGGTSPLKPKGYRFQVDVPEGAQLGTQADVRVAGVKVGVVQAKKRSPERNATRVTLQLDRRYAPIASDARATLRTKTVAGETYVDLTTGSRTAEPVPEGGLLPRRNVQETVDLDEILDTFDPYTRQAYRTWQRSIGRGIDGRGQDLNDALGSLPGFVEAGGDLFEVLDEQRGALKGLVKNTGVVFAALTEREDQLDALVRNTDTVFTSIQREREDFAQLWNVFPTFLDESRSTFRRLDRFSRNTEPLLEDLRPAFEDLPPTLRSVSRLSPDLKRLFVNLDPLLDESRKSLPASREIFTGLRPVVRELGPWLSELNPILDWLGQHEHTLTDIMANLGVATSARTKTAVPGGPGHYLRQYGPSGAETVAVHPRRLSSNRGNTYLNPLEHSTGTSPVRFKEGILRSFDCRNSGGEKDATDGAQGSPACRVQQPYRLTKFPHITREDYSPPTK